MKKAGKIIAYSITISFVLLVALRLAIHLGGVYGSPNHRIEGNIIERRLSE